MATVGKTDPLHLRIQERRFEGVLVGGRHDRVLIATDDQDRRRYAGQGLGEVESPGLPPEEVEEQSDVSPSSGLHLGSIRRVVV